MGDRLLIEIGLDHGDAEHAVRALVFLANELVESSTIEITDKPCWRERTGEAYQVKWRFTEDAVSSWQLAMGVELALQINDALRVAQSALCGEPKKRCKHTSNGALEAIQKAQAELVSFLSQTEPELCTLIAE